jgi:two-component system chemotaxis response regulator CheB
LHILIVDDDPVYRKMIQSALAEDSRYDVIGEATNGEEAVRLAAELKPEIITMDIRMPRMSGLDAAKAILSERPSTAIVFVSAFGGVKIDIGDAKGIIDKSMFDAERLWQALSS